MLHIKMKKWLALLLVTIMVIGTLPLSVIADVVYVDFTLDVEDEPPEAEPVDPGITVKLVSDGRTVGIYDLDGGGLTRISEGKYVFTGHPSDPDVPEGMLTFRGWFKAESDVAFDFSTVLDRENDKDLVLLAKFTSSYLISFKDAPGVDGQVRVAQEYRPNDPISLPDAVVEAAKEKLPEKNYVAYWYDEADASQQRFNFGTPATKDLTLAPKYENAHYVVFISAGTQVDQNVQMVPVGDKAIRPTADPTRTGYDFKHWSKSDNGSEAFDFNETITGDMALYAVWGPKNNVPYQVAIWMERANYVGPFPSNAPISEYIYVATMDRTGVAGEMTDVTASTYHDLFTDGKHPLLKYADFQRVDNQVINGDGTTVINLYATRKEYTFIFDLGTSSNFTMTVHGDVYKSGKDAALRYYYVYAKYEMDISNMLPLQGLDWFSFVDSSTTRVLNGWNPSKDQPDAQGRIQTIRNSLNSALLSPDGQVLKYTLTPSLEAGTARNYRYFVKPYPGQVTSPENMITVNNVDYVLMEEFNQNWASANVMTVAKVINGLEKVGHRFIPYVDGVWGTPTSTYKDGDYICFYYTRVTNPVSFHSGLDAATASKVNDFPANVNVLFDQPLTTLQPTVKPTVAGYTFVGWYRDAQFKEAFDFSVKMPNGPMAIYARWDSDAHTVEYYNSVNDTKPVKSEGVAENKTIKFAPYEVGTGIPDYGMFLRWEYKEAKSGRMVPFYSSMPVTRDYQLYATWKIEGIGITYDGGEGVGTFPVDENEYTAGVSVRIKAATGKLASGEVFYAWKDAKGNLYYPGSILIIWGDMTLTAQYAPAETLAKINYVPNHPVTGGASRLFEPKRNTLIDLEGRIFDTSGGYQLIGWSDIADNGGTVKFNFGSDFVVATAETTFYGVWEFIGFTIEFRAAENGYFATDAVTKFEGIGLDAPWQSEWEPKVSVAGDNTYFAGWSPVIPTHVNDDIIFYAQYGIKTHIEVTADSPIWYYDGKAHTSSIAEVTSETKLKGIDVIKVDTMGSITEVGTTQNTIVSHQIFRGDRNVTNEYSVTYHVGTLEVIPQPITITVGSFSKEFNTPDPQFTGEITSGALANDNDLGIISYEREAGFDNQEIGDYEGRLTASFALNSNYDVTIVPGNFGITANTSMRISMTNSEAIYSGEEYALANPDINVAGAALTYAWTDTEGDHTSDTMPVFKEAGTYTVSVSVVKDGYISPEPATATLTIAKADVTITVNNIRKVFGDADGEISGAEVGLLNGDDLNIIRKRAEAFENVESVGTYSQALTAEYTENNNYQVSVLPGNLEIVASNALKVTFDSLLTLYSGDDHALAAPQVRIEKEGEAPIIVDNAVLTYSWRDVANVEQTSDTMPVFSAAGTYPVTVLVSLDGYNPVEGDAVLTIEQRVIEIQVDRAEKEFGEPDPTFTGGILESGSLVNPNDLGTIVYGRRAGYTADDARLHEGVLTATYTPNPNYNVIVHPADLDIASSNGMTLRMEPVEVTYDGKEHTLELTGENLDGATLIFICNGKQTNQMPSFTQAGEYNVMVQAVKEGYLDKIAIGTLTIAPKEVIITVTPEQNKVYDDPDPRFTGTVEGLLNDGDLGTVYFLRDNEFTSDNVGVYEDAITANYTENSNYAVTVEPADFEIIINGGMKITAEGADVSYTGQAHTLPAATVTPQDARLTYAFIGDDGREQTSNTPPRFTDAGEYVVTISAERDGYAPQSTEVTLNIAKATAIITVDSKTKVFDAQRDPVFSGSVAGLIGRDSLGSVTYGREDGFTDEAVGVYEEKLTALYTENNNYEVTIRKGTLTIEANIDLTVGLDDKASTYNGALQYLDDAVASLDAKLTYYYDGAASETMPGFKDIGEYEITVVAQKEGYHETSAAAKLIIDKAPVTIVVHDQNMVFDTVEPNYTGEEVVLFAQGDLGTITYGRETDFADKAVGTYPGKLTAFYEPNDNYQVTVVPGTLVIEANETISVAIADKIVPYNGEPQSLEVATEASSDARLRYTYGEETTDTMPTFTAAGTYEITVTAEKEGYATRTSSAILTIERLPLEITVDSKIKTFDLEEPEFTGRITVGALAKADDIGTLAFGRAANIADANMVGDYGQTLTAFYTDNSSYDITVIPGNFSIIENDSLTLAFADASLEYNGEMQALADAVTNYDDAAVSYTWEDAEGNSTTESSMPMFADVGEYEVTAVATKRGYTSKTQTAVLTITPLAVQIQVNSASKIFGESDPMFSGRAMGLINDGDLQDLTYGRIPEFTEDNVGTYSRVLTATFEENANYDVTVERQDLHIEPNDFMSVALTGHTVVYDGAAHALANAEAAFANGEAEPEDATLTYTYNGVTSDAMPSFTAAGSYVITVTAELDGFIPKSKTATLNILKAPVEIRVAGAEKVFAQSDPAFTGSVTGLVNSSDLGTIRYERVQGFADETVKLHENKLTAVYTPNANYEVTVVNANFNITISDAMTVGMADKTVVYNGAAQSLDAVTAVPEDAQLTYVHNGQTSNTMPSFTNAGTYEVIVTAKKQGYITKTATAMLTITRLPVTITVLDSSKTFGAADPVFGARISAYAGEDLANINYNVVRTNMREGEPGTYSRVLTTAWTAEHWNAAYPNYDFTVVPGSFLITPKANIPYTIEYYFQNIAQTGYVQEAAYPPVSKTGTMDAMTSPLTAAELVNRPGFTFDETNADNLLSASIDRNGTTVLKLYYNRNSYSITYYYTNATLPAGATALPATQSYMFGAPVTVAANAIAPSHTFGGWIGYSEGKPFAMPAQNLSIYGKFTPISAPLTIHYLYEDGTVAAMPLNAVYPVGERFREVSPVLIGYAADQLSISAVMPTEGAAFTVVYKQNEVPAAQQRTYTLFMGEVPLAGIASRNVGESAE